MRNIDCFKNKRVTIIGLARSGFTSATLLYDLGAKVSVTDKNINESIEECASRLKAKDIRIELGTHTRGFIEDRDLIVLSPGVDNNSEPVVWAQNLHLPIISEIELAWRLCPATVIAVTGTNGKSTVTTLIAKILAAAGKPIHLCGNIGYPFSGKVSAMQPSDFVCLEVSSFQLERIDKFKPKISVILNIAPNHLDRYKNMQDYLKAKERIFMNQDSTDYLVINYNDPILRSIARQAKAKIIYFNKAADLNPNYSAAIEVAGILGIKRDLCLGVLKKFKGIAHRLEYVGKLKGVEFINDSKATTVDSTVWALNNIDRPIILIAGGRDKGLDFTSLRNFIGKKVKKLIVIGEAKEKIRNSLDGILPIQQADFFQEALEIAWGAAEEGDSILLSPMCASFDMFANFEKRGNAFKQAVRKFIQDKS